MSEDEGISVPQAVESVPPAVVHVATELPSLTKEGATSVAAVPGVAIEDSIKGLHSAVQALTIAANRLADKAAWVPPTIEHAIEEPIQSAESLSPEVVTPPKDRFIRRNGRKVKRA